MRLVDSFRARFGAEPQIWWAPGRVNLIGEHIDYCGGQVLPMPIQYGTHAAVAVTRDPVIHAVSHNAEQEVRYASGQPVQYPVAHWGRYVVGAVDALGDDLDGRGLCILVDGDVPGSGLSSSASLTVALVSAIGGVLGAPSQPLDLALTAQRIEHDYVGVSCGLMDQAVIAAGDSDAAYLFDCATQLGRPVRIQSPAPDLLVIDTGKRRVLVHSAYNERLAETERGAQALGVTRMSLAAAAAGLAEIPMMDTTARRRLRHVASEQLRVSAAVAAIHAGDWNLLGELFDASHRSLRDDFEVSCDELDTLVRLIRAHPKCLGARMTGAGFGGSVVALIEPGEAGVVDAVAQAYQRETHLTARAFAARSLGGVRQVYG